jgi:hypothetical protein
MHRLVLVFFFGEQREIWRWVNCKSVVTLGREIGGGVIKAEMFGQLTSGLESAWNKLKGEGLSLHTVCVHFN